MKAVWLERQAPIETRPLRSGACADPSSGEKDVLVRVHACGLCHTDLHIIEGDLSAKRLPLIPGHQIVGEVVAVGDRVRKLKIGERVGIPWLSSTCCQCRFCIDGKENLCDEGRFTGYDIDGGCAELVAVPGDSAYPLPPGIADLDAAPLLCAGVIGYRAWRMSGARPGSNVALLGFGASAHIVIQIATAQGCRVSVFSRSPEHRRLAEELGAAWTGEAGQQPPDPPECAIIFAPAGSLVPTALATLRKGGTLALAGIHMSPIPQMDYGLLSGEKKIVTVANSTRRDVVELLALAAMIPIRPMIREFPLAEANEALQLLKQGDINGAAVLNIA